jgi:quinol monooxygenase YgiN
MSKVAIVAKMTAKEGQRDQLVEALQPLLEAVKGESGTEVYAMHTDASAPEVVWFYELYTDQEAMMLHGTSQTMKAVGGELAGLLAGKAELHFLEPAAAKGLSI